MVHVFNFLKNCCNLDFNFFAKQCATCLFKLERTKKRFLYQVKVGMGILL